MILGLEHVSFRYAETPVLRDISFEVAKGEFLSLLGPNGSGKSTLLRLLNRILIPEGGKITLDGKDLSSYRRKELAKTIAHVPQDATWVFPFTVLQTVLMGRSPFLSDFGFESSSDIQIAHAMMELTDVEHLEGKPITALSGGERQRVLIARALTQEPQILLLDEPNAHLDLAHQLEVFEILRRLNKAHHLTIVSVSHDINLAATYSSRIAMLGCDEKMGRDGNFAGNALYAIGAPSEVLNESNLKHVFGTTVIVDRHPVTSTVRVSLVPHVSTQQE